MVTCFIASMMIYGSLIMLFPFSETMKFPVERILQSFGFEAGRGIVASSGKTFVWSKPEAGRSG